MSLAAKLVTAELALAVAAFLGITWLTANFGPLAMPVACIAGVTLGWVLRDGFTAWRANRDLAAKLTAIAEQQAAAKAARAAEPAEPRGPSAVEALRNAHAAQLRAAIEQPTTEEETAP
ncbi:hypothetical protein BST13_33735 [Mycobacterium aquaticum]|uniref:DUF4229 domain-containing protein n=2 Tax=Mycobacterium aquaticum TaxID=1927124 RepID=A0A1X0A4K4_9MYCO|nr:hypothetical protein BST13_33735 [Mycobacterium aquaticum]